MATYYARKTGNINAADVWATTPTGTAGNVFSSFTNADTLMSNGFAITINVNTTVLEIKNDNSNSATAGGGFTINDGVTLSSNIYSGAAVCLTYNGNAPNTATIVGNIYGGSSAVYTSVLMAGTGTLNITGNVFGGSGAGSGGVWLGSGGTINITGNVNGGAGSSAVGVIHAGNNGTLNIIGNVVAGNTATCHGVLHQGSTGTLNITGSVTGGGLSNARGVFNSINGTVNIFGTAIGGSAAPGAENNSTGLMTVTRAKGNGFGLGSSGLFSVVGVANNLANTNVRVYEIEYGDLGQSPTSGPIVLLNATTNVCLVHRPGSSKKTLISADSTANLLPAPSDVRSGVYYNYSNNVGTMSVPNAANVALGVSVDNTVGTAVLNANDIWNIATSGLNVSGSIGERLKNCSTVASAGQQLASSLSTF